MCALFVSVQVLAESAVGNGGRGAHERGGGKQSQSFVLRGVVSLLVELSDCCSFKGHWHDWISILVFGSQMLSE